MLEITKQSIQTGKIDRSHSSKTTQLPGMEQKLPIDEGQSVLQLPSDFAKTPSTTYQPEYHTFSLPDRLVESLTARTQLENVDIRSLLLAAFKTLLYRYTQQETIHLGLIIPCPSIDQNYITEICTLIYGELKVRELVTHLSKYLKNSVQENLLKSQERTQVECELSQRSKLPIVVTVLENLSGIEDEKQWLTELKQNSEFIDNLDLHLVIFQKVQGISGIFEYNANLFEPDTIERLSGHFQVVLAAIADDLDRTIAQLPLLTQTEQDQLLVEWRSASVNYPQIPIYQHIEAHAAHNPDAIAVRFKEQLLTYAELNQGANQLAHYLKNLGVEAEDRVAICVQPSLEIAIAMLGILKAGGVYVPLDSTHPKDRLTTIFEDTQAKVLLTQAQLLPNLPAIAQHTLCLDTDWETIQQFPTHNPEHEINLDQTAYIIYTSGTTGKPKGVMANHRNLVNYILATQERFGFNQDDVMPVVARFTFSIAMFELLSPLAAGGTLVVLERDHILDFKRLTQTLEQLTMLHTVPSLMQKLLAYIRDNGLDIRKFQGIKHVFTGGDIVAPDLLETMKNVFVNAKVYVLYGCSEVSSLCSSYPVPRDQIVTKSRVGKPFNNVCVRLYDSHQNLVPIGIPGEIYVSGAGVTKGYLHRDDLTQEKFVIIDGQRFYRTGDLGRFSADGNIEFLGRADFQVKLRGIRIELGEIESTLRQAPGVREGVVIARELGSGETGLVAYIVLDRGQSPAIEDIRRFLQAKLPDYMVPAAFVVLEAMPLNPNQKIDRRALPMPTPENLAGFKTVVPPRNDWERQLIEIWENVLGIQPIGIRHNFFDLGGTSLLAVQMLTQIEKLWGKNLPITTLLQAPTIKDLAKVLRSVEAAKVSDLVALRKGGSKPPLFCIYGILIYQKLVNHLDPEQPVYGVFLQEEVELLKTGKFDQQNSAFLSVPIVAARYLETIRSFQPHGPYYLAGESFGGLVAFEMAQQLQAAGEEVALVALFDSPAPSLAAQMSLVERLQLHRKLLSQHGISYISRMVQRSRMALQKKVLTGLHKVYQRSLLPQEGVSQEFTEEIQQDIRDNVRLRATQSYAPQPYSGRMVLFRAMERDEYWASLDYDMGWGLLAAGGLQIFDVPGDHLGILRDPNVQVLAAKLSAFLGAV